MQHFFYILCYLSFLLILGVIIKSKIKFFQELFIPASVVGGGIGLLISSEVAGKIFGISIPSSWTKDISLLPGILIVPVIASIPLGMELKLKNKKGEIRDVLVTGFILFIITFLQLGVGYFINFFYKYILKKPLYPTFGAELNSGFAGGHGTAGMIGRTLQEMNIDYWATAQGVAVTTATFGLVGGIILGIFLINKACRNGETVLLKNPSSIPYQLKRGYYTDITKHQSLGRETMLSSSIDTLAFHIAIVFSVCGISYIILNFIKKYKIPILSSVSIWIFAMLLMMILWSIMKKMELDWCIDVKIKGRVSALFTEFAIVSAIASLPLKAIFTYFFPILIMIILGFLTTWYAIKFYCYKYFKNNYPFERAISMAGTSFGVFFTGVLLLKICDPDLSSPVLGDYSLGFSMTAFLGPFLIISSINLSLISPIIPISLHLGLILIFSFILSRMKVKDSSF